MMVNKVFATLVISVSFLIPCTRAQKPAPAQEIYVAYPESTNPQDSAYYYQQALRLALDKTLTTDGDYILVFSSSFYSLERITQLLINSNHADVMWGSVSEERKAIMQVIPVDLLRGLNNYRVLVINKNNQHKFSKIKNFEEFKKLKSGGGAEWTSTKILQTNGIEVKTAPYYHSILRMLSANRFDYISRGLHEAPSDPDFAKSIDCDVKIESSILLQYKTPVEYSFYVNKKNLTLADRLTRGLAIAEEDGSLLDLFNSMAVFKRGLELLAESRKVYVLENH